MSTIKELVIKEAKNIKKFASEKEISRLSFSDLDPSSKLFCIYGQLTTDCTNARAEELICLCAERVYDFSSAEHILKSPLNGKPKYGERQGDMLNFISPIEKFIVFPRNQNNGNNERIVEFLKGERKTLKLI